VFDKYGNVGLQLSGRP